MLQFCLKSMGLFTPKKEAFARCYTALQMSDSFGGRLIKC